VFIKLQRLFDAFNIQKLYRSAFSVNICLIQKLEHFFYSTWAELPTEYMLANGDAKLYGCIYE
jgi:hypothetical protein